MSVSEQSELAQLVALYRSGQLAESLAAADRLAQRFPNASEVFWIGGAARLALGRPAEAAQWFRRMLALAPKDAVAHNNLGMALQDLGRRKEALLCFERAIKFNSALGDAHNNRGIVLSELGRVAEAIESYQRALAVAPDHAGAHNNLGDALRAAGRSEEAVAHFSLALKATPLSADVYANLGAALQDLDRLQEAETACRRALEINPRHAEALNNLGSALSRLERVDEAIECYRRAVALKPNYARAHLNLGAELQEIGARQEAIASLQRAVAADPGLALARAELLHQLAHICDWDGLGGAWQDALGIDGPGVSPFAMLALDDDPGRHRIRAETIVREKYGQVQRATLIAAPMRPGRLRIGYFSADFYNHATMFLIARLLEAHDRSRFEIQAFSFGPDVRDEMAMRARASVDVFHDVRSFSDRDIAALARAQGIDIAVDLGAHAGKARMKIFALGAAPIQINFLGYPGTSGAPFIDYIVADSTVIPEDAQKHYSEKIIYLPHSYQATDDSRAAPAAKLSRAEAGLPDAGLVFCCFNNSYKITPREFDIWMRLLHATPASVLWLLHSNALAAENLRKQASRRGIEPSRLIFAEHLPVAQHLARHQLADLFLDTFNYNAHTTASDALWAGLPVITKPGASFPARVAASLLRAIDMPELIAASEAEYETRALELATDAGKLAALKAKLAAHRTTKPLFDSVQFARSLEAAYEQIYQRAAAGAAPETIWISPIV